MTRSRNRRLRLIPSHLPLIRDKLAEYERVALKEEMAAHSQYERSMEAAWNFADNLAVAQLWWISRDMTALAEDTVRAGDFPKSEAPAQSGLIFFDGDVQMVRFPVTDDATGRKVGDAHVSALFWQCDGNGDIKLMGFTDHPCALKECDAKSFSLPVIRFANGIFNEHVGGFRWFGDLLRAVPSHVDLLYYRSQEHYDRYGRDKGDYAIVNARSREIAAILESQGIEARFRYPEDDEAGFQRLANTR